MKNIVASALIILSLFACNKNEIPPIPTLPPSSSLSMNFELLNNEKSANLIFENWLYSMGNISIFSAISTANVSIPAIAYSFAFTQKPIFIGDMTWQWSYEFQAINTYTATLNATTDKRGKKTTWEMYISNSGINGFEDFLWFEGVSTDSTSANWTIYRNPSSPVKVIMAEWQSNAAGDERELKYTYYNSSDNNNNSTITYMVGNNSEYDKTYKIYLSSIDAKIDIEWNSEFHNGKVMSENHYNDEEWHCWNEILIDTSCD